MPSMENWLATFGAIFAVVDPFGYVPIFLSMTTGDSETNRRRTVRRACIASFFVLTISLFLGRQILGFFGISLSALQISGGLILLIVGFEMMKVLPWQEKLSDREQNEANRKEDISIVPLAIPMLSGPASIVTVIVQGSRAESLGAYVPVVVSVALTLIITWVVLSSASRLLKFIGITGLNVMTRIMGLLLCAMAVQQIIDGYHRILGS